MNVVSRGVRNAFRNATRTISIVIILGLSIGLSLVMLIANRAVDSKIQTTLHSIGTTVQIRPAGFDSGSSTNNALTSSQLAKVKKLAHVKSLAEVLNGHMQTEGTTSQPTSDGHGEVHSSGAEDNNAKTNLKSPVKLNSDGSGGGGGLIISSGGNGAAPKLPDNFSLPITITGTSDPTNPASIDTSELTIVSGKAIDGSKDSNEAMISQAMADKNNLKVGSTFTAYGVTLKVAAIFKTNTQSGDGVVIVSLPTMQRLSNHKDSITGAVATADSLENLSSVTDAVKKALGSSADVTSNLDEANRALQPLKSVKQVSFYSLIGSVAAGAVIILLTMIMIVRERRREIGILKAIGGSNVRIMVQFMSEALTFTLLGAAIGLVFGVVGGNPVTSTLVGGSNSNNGGGAGSVSFGGPLFADVKNVQAHIGWDILLYGLGAAVLIALIGSAISSYLISKVRPAEVLRSE